ncbi:unnamed protein product [Aphanomyces euteiches]|uniref:Protein kinase domain-containing protein n=1 Tax=Aphanomyces euteiches TaxID=100861 RepID=A0A6G0W7L9_9STRA|nr:hypothetical protein Ae201684_017905 [Aphanomyces euteiches]KAH9095187.1 hypothetical protein Ae201684P_015637 [Aphanomyces euteiches]KAH9152539.1 hypothetical protein AeRB84_005047 [Aphanomyces euteiches]
MEDDDMQGVQEYTHRASNAAMRSRPYMNCGTDYHVGTYLVALFLGTLSPAPEVRVVVYIMLCGYPPFQEDETGMEAEYRKITSGMLEFPDPYWSNDSDLVYITSSGYFQPSTVTQ